MKKKGTKWLFERNNQLRKLFKIMRLSVILLFIGMHLTFANVGAQSKVTIEHQFVTYQELFTQIQKQTGLTVVYSNNELNKDKKIQAGFVQMELKDVLDKVLAGTNLSYEFMDEFVILKVIMKDEKKKTVSVTGKVVDEKNMALPGVTVMVKDLKLGTTTGPDGRYVLTIPKVDNILLVFSFVGMHTQEVKYTGQDSVNVVMKDDIEVLEDVVVTGYGNMSKGNYTGAATTMKAEDIMMAGVSSIDQMLQGVVPGMLVQQGTGMVGASPKIRVRGVSSLLGSQEPVWVVDGVNIQF